MGAAMKKITELFHRQHEPAAIMAVAEELETSYKQLTIKIKLTDIMKESWNVVQILKMHTDTTYGHISDLNLPSRSLPKDCVSSKNIVWHHK